ncbi:MAG: TIGR03668 family PPOX class F420-dependent oxidoreductase [Chloroflexota bacterium]|nr:TIGR03668 family PPOX class F420-dependent oxidoreductase [Chloroflexota bacterium]MDE2682906.1 TIGR03668 family PPOX class F420-dependent oxidoreductase [Chloroflexota bacterium]
MAGKREGAALSQQQVELLNQTPVGHLATADAHGRPHVIPFCFVCDGGIIYSALDAKPKSSNLRGLRRVRNILANPQVSLVIDHYESDWSRLWYLMVQGNAELLEPCPEQAAAISLLRGKYQQYREMDLEHSPVIKITPDRATGWSGA